MKSLTASRYLQEHLSKVKPPPKDFDEVETRKREIKVSKFKPVWSERIHELKTFFDGAILFCQIKINAYTIIKDPQLFVATHLSVIEFNNGNPRFLVYLERLEALMAFLLATGTHDSATAKKHLK